MHTEFQASYLAIITALIFDCHLAFHETDTFVIFFNFQAYLHKTRVIIKDLTDCTLRSMFGKTNCKSLILAPGSTEELMQCCVIVQRLCVFLSIYLIRFHDATSPER